MHIRVNKNVDEVNMGRLTDVSITIACRKCRKKNDLVDGDIDFVCDKCKDKDEEKDWQSFEEQLMNLLFHNLKSELNDASSIVGFKSEEEKLTFMQGVRYGYIDAMFHIADRFGYKAIKMWEKFNDESFKLPINVYFNPDQEKETEEWCKKNKK